MEQFPGRFLEEIEHTDVNRVLRAKTVKRYEAAEARRRLYQAGKVKATDLSADELALFAEMDAIEAESDG